MIELTPADRRVWAVLSASPALTTRELARCMGYRSSGTVQRHITRLMRAGILKREPFQARAYVVVQKFSWVDV